MKAKEFYNQNKSDITNMFEFAEAYAKSEFNRKIKEIRKQHAKDLEQTYESAREDGFNSSSL